LPLLSRGACRAFCLTMFVTGSPVNGHPGEHHLLHPNLRLRVSCVPMDLGDLCLCAVSFPDSSVGPAPVPPGLLVLQRARQRERERACVCVRVRVCACSVVMHSSS